MRTTINFRFNRRGKIVRGIYKVFETDGAVTLPKEGDRVILETAAGPVEAGILSVTKGKASFRAVEYMLQVGL